jgi:hypothetical protein
MKEEELILVSAVRYALGRMTYIVSATSSYVKKQTLSEKCKAIIIRDIEEELERDHGGGMSMDREEWYALLAFLQKL